MAIRVEVGVTNPGRLRRRAALAGAVITCFDAISIPAQSAPHPLGTVEARSAALPSVFGVRVLSSGMVIVHDPRSRTITLLNDALQFNKRIAAPDSDSPIAYRSRFGAIVPWLGDSTLFVDPEVRTITVVDGRGTPVRTERMPLSDVAACLAGSFRHSPMVSPTGQVICRMPAAVTMPEQRTPPDTSSLATIADSAALIRYDFNFHRADTIAFLRVGSLRMSLAQSENCEWFIGPVIQPLPRADDWTLTSDGRIAVLRDRGYMLEWLGTPRPRENVRLTPPARTLNQVEKVAVLDSVKAHLYNLREGVKGAPARRLNGGGQCTSSAQPKSITVLQPHAVEDPERLALGIGRVFPPLLFAAPKDLPDTAPNVVVGDLQSDPSGNIWIRTRETRAGASVYNILDRTGAIVDRLLIPASSTIAGFGKTGALYLVSFSGDGVHVERARR